MAGVNSGSHAEITVSEGSPGCLTVKLSGELDILSVDRLNGQIEKLLASSAEKVALDLSDLTFMDSSGIGMLLRLTNQFGPSDVHGASALIRRVISVTGLTDILRLGDATL